MSILSIQIGCTRVFELRNPSNSSQEIHLKRLNQLKFRAFNFHRSGLVFFRRQHVRNLQHQARPH